MNFMNKLELNDRNYRTNGNIRDKNCKGTFLFTIKRFVSFGSYCKSMYFMSTRFLKENIHVVCVI